MHNNAAQSDRISATFNPACLAGQTALVTGAGQGLGRACALAMAAAGARVVLLARTRDKLAAVCDLIQRAGGDATPVVCDLEAEASLERTLETIGPFDILLNGAGTNVPQKFLDVDLTTLDRLLALNVRAMFRVCQAAARGMIARRRGAIVNMSSQMGHVGAAGRSVYCMTKHAVEGLTKALAVELAPFGIRVNSVAPTYIETPMTEPFFRDAAFKDAALRDIPLGRLGVPDEVAAAVVFLASPAASLITGTSLLIDGGYTAR